MNSLPKEVGEADCPWAWTSIGIVCHCPANSFS